MHMKYSFHSHIRVQTGDQGCLQTEDKWKCLYFVHLPLICSLVILTNKFFYGTKSCIVHFCKPHSLIDS